MSGTFRGKVECFFDPASVGAGEQATAQVIFKNLFDVFSSHPNATLVALQHGSGTFTGFTTGAGGGTDYFDGTTPFENNAFFVFRMETTTERSFPYYVLIQWSGNSTLGDPPGDPAIDLSGFTGNDGFVGWSVAIGEGGDENPWNGTTNADGTDTKGDPVWVTPSAGTRVHVFPRDNNPGPNEDTQKKILGHLIRTNTNDAITRHSFIVDDDNIWFVGDTDDNGSWNAQFFGLYTPRSGLSPTYPVVALMQTANLPISTSDNAQVGGVSVPRATSDGVKIWTLERVTNLFTSTRQPNDSFDPPEFDEMGVQLLLHEAQFRGYAGVIENLREVFDVSSGDTNQGLTQAYFGDTSISSEKVSVPWDGATAPLGGTLRGGTDFTRTP